MKKIIKTLALTLTLSGLAAPVVQAKEFVNVLTGGTSGVYYPLGNTLSSIYAESIPDSKVTVQSTKASVENLNLLQQGRGELAFTLGDSLSNAWKGNADAGFKAPLNKLRGIAAIYPNFVQIVASKESGIKTLADLKGKRVSVGAPKSGTELNARTLFAAAGLSYDDMDVQYLPFGESVELMKNRQLDATLQSAGLGVASIRDLASTHEIVVVSIPADVIKKTDDPAYNVAEIPADTYSGQTAPVQTASIYNYLVTRADVSDDVAYAMTKGIFENLDKLVASHSAAKGISLEHALQGMPVPLHPGAERYFREKGLIK